MFDDCKSLNDIAKKYFGKANYTNREKSKKLLSENGIDWRKWLDDIKESKTRYCVVCGKRLEKDQVKFCSHSCSAIFNNGKRGKNKRKSRTVNNETGASFVLTGEKRFCLNCGKELQYHQDKFCSRKCYKEFDYKNYIKNWKDGKEDGLCGSYGISGHIRRFLMEKNNCRCEICGWGEMNKKTGKVPLQVHHIDGDYRNNKEENLQLLCPNCHSLTDTYMALNRNGRKGRKKYDNPEMPS